VTSLDRRASETKTVARWTEATRAAPIEKNRALSRRSVQMEVEATYLRTADRAAEAVGVVERTGEGFEDMLAVARDARSGCRRSGVGF
jgi:hypothetical protein